MTKKTKQTNIDLNELQEQLQSAREAEKRALADYQNLVRRQQDERVQIVKFATKELVSDLLQPLDHLQLAADQLGDQGLNMVLAQFWQKLNDHGLEEVNPVGQPFNINEMEAADGSETDSDQSNLIVSKVIKKGYKLNGNIIQFAKVLLVKK